MSETAASSTDSLHDSYEPEVAPSPEIDPKLVLDSTDSKGGIGKGGGESSTDCAQVTTDAPVALVTVHHSIPVAAAAVSPPSSLVSDSGEGGPIGSGGEEKRVTRGAVVSAIGPEHPGSIAGGDKVEIGGKATLTPSYLSVLNLVL